jgi:hypothetical protein
MLSKQLPALRHASPPKKYIRPFQNSIKMTSEQTDRERRTQNRPTITGTQDVDFCARALPSVIVSNVLSDEEKRQVIALGRLG